MCMCVCDSRSTSVVFHSLFDWSPLIRPSLSYLVLDIIVYRENKNMPDPFCLVDLLELDVAGKS